MSCNYCFGRGYVMRGWSGIKELISEACPCTKYKYQPKTHGCLVTGPNETIKYVPMPYTELVTMIKKRAGLT